MPAPEDDRFFSATEVKAAASHGHLPVLVERLARDRSWFALGSVFEQIAGLPITTPVLTETVRRCALGLRNSPDRRKDRAAANEELRTVRLLAGEALIARVPGPALTETDRMALTVGAGALADGGDLQRAAATFERARNWAAAAEVWGRLGELDRMETCLLREEDGQRNRRAAIGAIRDIEGLAAAGERVAALRLAESVPEGTPESNAARHTAIALAARLIRSRSVTLRASDELGGRSFCFAATPAILGRDPLAEVSLRDPGVSRRHALIAVVGGEVSLTDAGSRSGTFVAGARLSSALLLRGSAEIALGASCRLAVEIPATGRVLLRGLSSLDRGLVAIVGTGALPLGDVVPGAAGTWLEFDPGGVRFCRAPEIQVRVAGQLVSTRVDLLRGDALDIGAGAARLEIG